MKGKVWDRKSKRPKALWVQVRDQLHPQTNVVEPRRRLRLRRGIARQKRPTSISWTRKSALKIYSAKAASWLRLNPRCAVFPLLKSTEVHHVLGRLGTLLIDERFWLPVSRRGHAFIHENIYSARIHGWIAATGDWNRCPTDATTTRLAAELREAVQSNRRARADKARRKNGKD
jgi:hypothetical protein